MKTGFTFTADGKNGFLKAGGIPIGEEHRDIYAKNKIRLEQQVKALGLSFRWDLLAPDKKFLVITSSIDEIEDALIQSIDTKGGAQR